jgi:hypothetical protein
MKIVNLVEIFGNGGINTVLDIEKEKEQEEKLL